MVFFCSSNKLGDDKLPKVNWSQHAAAHDNFLNPAKYSSSNFLYSLPNQKPSVDEPMRGRYVNALCIFACSHIEYSNAAAAAAAATWPIRFY